MIDPAISDAFEATWPALEYADAGGFRVGRGAGAGGRVSSARKIGSWREADIEAAVGVHRGWDQPAIFRVQDDDSALAASLAARGLQRQNPTAILSAPILSLTQLSLPPVTAFTIWPPLAIQREIWSAGNIGPARQDVMVRVGPPMASILGRINDRAAGTGFVAIHGGIAMMHALEIVPDQRRQGLAGWMVRQAAFWAKQNYADQIALAVSRGNAGAVALYRKLGFAEVGGYAYYA